MNKSNLSMLSSIVRGSQIIKVQFSSFEIIYEGKCGNFLLQNESKYDVLAIDTINETLILTVQYFYK